MKSSINVGAFFFLRFVAPSITLPHVYGLINAPPTAMVNRQFVLLAMVIQNLSNNTMLDTKEAHMASLNDFASKNFPRLASFFSEICDSPGQAARSVAVSSVVEENAFKALDSLLICNHAAYESVLTVPDIASCILKTC